MARQIKARKLEDTATATCIGCGKAWVNHRGLQGTCKDLQKAKKALRVVYLWATGGKRRMPAKVAQEFVAAIKGGGE